MLHTILSKRKVLLDHLRKGLETLGVLEKASTNPLLFESLFVASDESLTPEKAKDSLKFPGDTWMKSKSRAWPIYCSLLMNALRKVIFNLYKI